MFELVDSGGGIDDVDVDVVGTVLGSVVATELDDDEGTLTDCVVNRLVDVDKSVVVDEADVGGDLGTANDVCVVLILDEVVVRYVDWNVVVGKRAAVVDIVVVYSVGETTVSDCSDCVMGDKDGL